MKSNQDLVLENERLQAEVGRLSDKYQRDVYGLNNEGDPIGGDPAAGYANDLLWAQSELTKARELLNQQEEFIESAWQWLPIWLRKTYRRIDRQSAPAAKGEE